MRYSCLAPGKRLRPALCMAAAEAVGGSAIGVVDAACAIEMVHCFSLIHDDLPAIDNDELRRGLPTCHVKFGEAMAILAGDALFALAFRTLGSTAGPAERVLAALNVLSEATGSEGVVGGEVVDVQSEGKVIDAETLRYIHAKKTGALIAASCEIGALLGGASDIDVAHLRRYGEHVGLAFQIVDDILNETSTPEQLGKSAGSDRERGKATYPAVFGLEASRTKAREATDAAIAELAHVTGPTDFLCDLARFTIERTA